MSRIEIADAAADLPALVARALDGEEIVLTEGGAARARIVSTGSERQDGRRTLGRADGLFRIPDDFDAPLPDDVLELFYGGPLPPLEPDPGTRER